MYTHAYIRSVCVFSKKNNIYVMYASFSVVAIHIMFAILL